MRGKESCDKNLADMSKRYEAQLAELRRSHSQVNNSYDKNK